MSKLVTLMGFIFLLSWFLNINFILEFIPDLPGIKFNSALLLFLSGICSWIWVSQKPKWIGKLLALLILVQASTSLIQDFFSLDLGIDELFLTDLEGRLKGIAHPGRLPAMTAIIFILFGLSHLLMTSTSSKLIVGQFLLHGITLLTFIALTGFLINVPDFYTLSFLVGISPAIALIWFVFSAFLTLIHPDLGITGLLLGKQKGSVLARRLTPRILVALFILTALMIIGYRKEMFQVDFGIALLGLSFLIVALFLVWDAASWLNRSDKHRMKADDDLRKANENLEKMVEIRNQELKGILDSAAVSIIATDKNGLIRHFSKGAEQMLDYTAEEVISQVKPEFFHFSDEIEQYAQVLRDQTGQSIDGDQVFTHLPIQGKVFSQEWNYKRKDGSKVPVQLNISKITSNHGKDLGFIGIATDISQLAESREKLKNLLEKIEAKNKQLLNFAHIISHNLRTPVISLDALIGYYKEETNLVEKEELFGLIESVMKNLSTTMEETVNILRVQEDRGQIIEEVGFAEIFEKVKTALIGKIMETSADISTDFSSLPTVRFSKSYMESIFLNLLSNSIKYRKPDLIPLISIRSSRKDGKRLLEFNDNGLGIDLVKYGKNVFSMNKTFHSNSDAKGIGLYIVKTQVESLDSKISIKSEVNQGTTFTIEFG